MDCPAGVTVTVSVSDLQEMHNNLRAQVEAGLGSLRTNLGQNGLPAAPPDAISAPPRPTISAQVPALATDTSEVIEAARQQADQTENHNSPLLLWQKSGVAQKKKTL
jgi:hypothetical protein